MGISFYKNIFFKMNVISVYVIVRHTFSRHNVIPGILLFTNIKGRLTHGRELL